MFGAHYLNVTTLKLIIPFDNPAEPMILRNFWNALSRFKPLASIKCLEDVYTAVGRNLIKSSCDLI